MYDKSSWGGSVDPFILTKISNSTFSGDSDEVVSFAIYEWADEHLIGLPAKDGSRMNYICDSQSAKDGLCTTEEIGQFILQSNASTQSKKPITTVAIHLKDPRQIRYEVKKTGYYCVWTYGFDGISYDGVTEFRNAYGELAAAQIPKLPFYGGMTIAYAVIGAFWAFLYVQNRHDVLPVQNYITAILIFLVVEQLLTWGFYDYSNNHGNNLGTKALMVVTTVLNAARNSFSFFLLLIVCMGYGVVKETLGKTMLYVRILALAHFLFGLIYGVGSLSITPENVGPIVLLVIMPLAGTLTAFYVWTLNSLNATMKDLMERKQTVKATMYRRLWWAILGSILVIFAFFFFNSFTYAKRDAAGYVPNHWKTRWFVLDGWLNIVYLFDICFIAYLWRPTANNRRFAMSDEVRNHDLLRTTLMLTKPHRSRKMTTATSKSPPSVVSQMTRRKAGQGKRTSHQLTALAVSQDHNLPSQMAHRARLFRCKQCPRHLILKDALSMRVRRSLLWVKTRISGQMRRSWILRSGKD